jgi:hypothetical protein
MSLCVAVCAPFGLFLPVGCCPLFFLSFVLSMFYVYHPAAVRHGPMFAIWDISARGVPFPVLSQSF